MHGAGWANARTAVTLAGLGLASLWDWEDSNGVPMTDLRAPPEVVLAARNSRETIAAGAIRRPQRR